MSPRPWIPQPDPALTAVGVTTIWHRRHGDGWLIAAVTTNRDTGTVTELRVRWQGRGRRRHERRYPTWPELLDTAHQLAAGQAFTAVARDEPDRSILLEAAP